MSIAVEPVEWVTGERSPNRTDQHWCVGGTDLGMMWDDGHGTILTIWEDTFNPRNPEEAGGGASGGGDWRSNVVAFSTDWNPQQGMRLNEFLTDAPGHARQVIWRDRPEDFSIIPTGVLTVTGGRQYIAYMSIHGWGDPGEWTTNYAGLAWSDNGGRDWVKDAGARWYNTADWQQGFQMCSLAQDGPWVYLFGTPNGRRGPLRLARAPFWDLLNLESHRQWNGHTWVKDPVQATPIISGEVGETSVAYHRYSGKWLLTYLYDREQTIYLHEADSPVGPWSEGRVLVTEAQYPGLYGAFWHPWSLDDPNPVFMMSQWAAYNTRLMRAYLSPGSYDEAKALTSAA